MGEFVLKNKNYFLLFLGSLVSNLGTHVYNFAISLYILKITDGNATLAGFYMAFGGIVFFALSPFGGAIVDRLDKVKVVYIPDLINGAVIITAGFLIFSDISTTLIIVILYICSLILSINGTLFNPAASSLPPHILEENQLQQSSSLSQGMFALYGIIGAILGGILYSFVAIEWIFVINGLTFVFSGISEMFITVKTFHGETSKISIKETLSDIAEGVRYVLNLKPIFYLVAIASLLNFFTMPVIANGMPYLFEVELAVDPYYLGILNMSFPIGVIFTSIVLGSRAQEDKVSPLIIRGLFGMACCFTVFAIAAYLIVYGHINLLTFMIVSWLALVVTGFFNGFINIPFGVAIMKAVAKEKMGRVFSVIGFISNGLTPIAIGLGGIAITYLGLMNLFYVAVIAMFLTFFLAKRNQYVNQL